MGAGSNMRGLLQGGTMVALGLWIAALATQHWHVKTFYIGMGISAFGGKRAELSMSLVTYSWHCEGEIPKENGPWQMFVRSFCEKPFMNDAMLTELSMHMCAIEEQSFGFLKTGCDKAQIVAYVSLGCMVLIGLSLLFTICAATFVTMDPGGKPVQGLFMSAPIIQIVCLITYVAVTYDLSDFYDTDQAVAGLGQGAGALAGALGGAGVGAAVNAVANVGGKLAVNDLDETITFGYSFFIAVGACVTNFVLAWCAWLFVSDVREREQWAFAKEGGGDNGTFDQQWDQQGAGWDQQQWGPGQQPQQQWGAAAAGPGWQQTTTHTQWHGPAGPAW